MVSLLVLCVCALCPQDDAGEQLRNAASRGDLRQVQKLIEAQADVDAVNDYGRTALGLAVSGGYADVAAALLDAGADIEKADRFYRFTPLTMAVIAKKPATIRLLIERKAAGAGAALMFVVSADQPDVLKALLTDKSITQAQLRAALSAARDGEATENIKLLEPLITGDPEETAAESAAKTPMRSAAQLKPFEGKFEGPGETEMVIKAGPNKLDVQIAGQELTLTPSGETEFRVGEQVVVQFKMVDGVAKSFTWSAGGGSIDFTRTKAEPEPAPDMPDDAPAKDREPVNFADYQFESPNWPAFRGTLSRGINNGQNLPTQWDAKSGKNIVWKTPVAGLGLSCPVVWGDNIFVSTAVPAGNPAADESQLRTGLYGDVDSVEDDREYEFRLLCVSLSTGDVLWDRKCHAAKPRVKRHTKSSHANPTPATNGEYVVVSFASEGVYCYRTDGELAWKKDFGFLDSGWFFDRTFQWGFGSSPYIFEDTVYLQCDIQDQSFLVALDLVSGDERWRVDRKDIPTWSSPVAYADPTGANRLALNGTREAAVYDAGSGKRIWSLGGMSEIVVPTPQVTPGYVLLASGYAPVRPILAVRHSATGELSRETSRQSGAESDGEAEADNEAESDPTKAAAEDKPTDDAVPDPFAWQLRNGGSYLPTPIIYQGYVHVVSNSGVVSCFDASTGERVSQVRLRGARSCTGSPVAADGRIYVTAENGKTFVLPAGPNGKPGRANELGEAVLSTPAIAGGRLLIRAENHLFAIGTKDE